VEGDGELWRAMPARPDMHTRQHVSSSSEGGEEEAPYKVLAEGAAGAAEMGSTQDSVRENAGK